MIVFPNCKINLGLNVLRKRGDGFHELETVFYPVAVHDILETIPQKESTDQTKISFSLSGLAIEGNKDDNLCLKAYHLIKQKFPRVPPVQMHLHKVIPAGSGLGGGSADAAFTLKMLNEIYGLNLSGKQLMEFSSALGSDCPFFMINQPCFSAGRGELPEEIKLDLGVYRMLLVNPGIAIHTREAFAGITPALPEVGVKEIITKPVEAWKAELKNDFEKIIFPKYPEIEKIKNEMYGAGALYASMSGTGSTVYGIFSKERATGLTFPAHYFIRELTQTHL